jgi:hypothetical protein
MTADSPKRDFIEKILTERRRQDEQWGGPRHDDGHAYPDWLRFIRGQLSGIMLIHGGKQREEEALMNPDNLAKFEERMVKVAALAMAAVESTRRKMEEKR